MNNLNPSGHKPFDKKILVRMDRIEEKVGSLYLPPDARDKQQLAEIYGTVVAVGANAFGEAIEEAERLGRTADVPQPGDRICLARYAGVLIHQKKTKDGNEYRMCNDEDVVAVVEEW